LKNEELMFETNRRLKAQLEEQIKALQACEAGFHNIIARSADGIVTIDRDGSIRFVNPAAEAIFDRKKEELLGKPFGFPVATGGATELEILQRGKKASIVEMRVVETEWQGSPAFVATLHDITDRKRREEQLRVTTDRLHSILGSITDAYYAVDSQWRLLEINPVAERVFQRPAAELLGKVLWDEYPQAVDLEFYRQFHIAVSEKKPVHFEAPSAISGRWYETHAYPRGAEMLEVFFRDITLRKSAEEALRESEERFRATFDQAAVGIAHLDLDGHWLRINQKLHDILGYREEELRKLTLADITHPEDLKKSLKSFQLLLNDVVRYTSLEKRYIRKDGSAVWVNVTVSKVSPTDGGNGYFVAVVEDISERKKAQEEVEVLNMNLAAHASELEAANRELEAFNYTVSHDLRKPLTIINGYCQAIRGQCGDRLDPECIRYLDETYEGTLRMNRLIDALLQFSHLTRGELNRGTVGLCGLAREVALKLSRAEPDRSVSFHITDGITVYGDKEMLRVALENLLGNAWKYTAGKEDAMIEFGVTEREGEPVYFVRDNGAGFDMADAEKMFIPFQRLPGSEKYEGHGIGLATVERIIKRHGGRVWAEGEPGKGATFYFNLG